LLFRRGSSPALRNCCRPVVFNELMKRFSLATAMALSLLAALAPVSASAKVLELGATKTPLVAPSCPTGAKPTQCTIVLTEVTALETLRDGLAYPTKVTRPGQIVAFTLGLSRLDPNRNTARTDIHNLNANYRGQPSAAVSVLKPTGKKGQRKFKVVSQSPIVHLLPYLGQVAQFPLSTPLQVKRGEYIALSVPTWAPVLSIKLPGKKFAYRQGRTKSCKTASTANLAQRPRQSARYLCNYPGTRLEYSATEITTPSQTQNYVR
jgi:hypothetical protein